MEMSFIERGLVKCALEMFFVERDLVKCALNLYTARTWTQGARQHIGPNYA